MKKSELLTLSVAVAGSVIAMIPQTAAATACGTPSLTAPTTCTISSGGYLAEDIIFQGSRGVDLSYDNQDAYFATCAWHIQGKNSFGMTTQSSDMTTRVGTGTASTDAASGCS